jgi:hypothetical protein
MINGNFAAGFYLGLLIGLVLVSILMYANVKVPVLSAFSVLNTQDDVDEYENIGLKYDNKEYEWQYMN